MKEAERQFFPLPGHYSDLEGLIREIKRAQQGFALPFENEVNKTYYEPDLNTFEVVLSSKGDKVLIPNALSYPALFRGQTQDWGTCMGSLYRHNYDEIDIFIQRLKLVEFGEIIKTHPVVQGFFLKNNYRVSTIGLAQHYGLQTEMVDLTNDIDIAAFFAVCPYDSSTDSYKTISDNKTRVGVIYAILLIDYLTWPTDNFLDEKIEIIGMQPFLRPGLQKAFSIRLEKEESLFAMKYTFNYTKKDSSYYFKKFQYGETLWPKDEIVEIIKPIINQTCFSWKTLSKTFDLYRPKRYSKIKLITALLNKGVLISHKRSPAVYPSDRIQKAVHKWETDQVQTFCENLRRKPWCYTEATDEDGNKIDTSIQNFRSLEMIGEMELLRLLGVQHKQEIFPVERHDTEAAKPEKNM